MLIHMSSIPKLQENDIFNSSFYTFYTFLFLKLIRVKRVFGENCQQASEFSPFQFGNKIFSECEN